MYLRDDAKHILVYPWRNDRDITNHPALEGSASSTKANIKHYERTLAPTASPSMRLQLERPISEDCHLNI